MKPSPQWGAPGTLHATWTKASDSSQASHPSEFHVFANARSPPPPPASDNDRSRRLFNMEAGTRQHNRRKVLLPGTIRSLPEHQHHGGHYAVPGKRIHSAHDHKHLTAPRRFQSAGGTLTRAAAVAAAEQKGDSLSFFDIEMDKSPFYQYRPGEEISGAVHIDVRRAVEVRFVDLLIVGEGAVVVVGDKQGLASSQQETYLSKKTFLIGTDDPRWSSVLTPGHYLSRFRFRLPKDLPSSIMHDDLSSGFALNISYYIKARICDDVDPASASCLVKVLASCKHPFSVLRHFDLNLVPSAHVPVAHTEEVAMSSCARRGVLHVSLDLERAVFLAGDDIKLQLSTLVPPPHRIKSLTCQLLIQLRLDRQADPCTFTLSSIEHKDPQTFNKEKGKATYNVTIPTQTNLVTSFLHGCTMLRLSYCLAIEVRLAPGSGKLSLTIPIAIGPCAEPIYADKISSRKAVPVFNRPMRFPFFSPTQGERQRLPDQSSRSSRSVLIVTKYSNSFWARCFICCTADAIID